ncbi:MAG: hypothetical protein HY011_01855 [Acidobacteria bacterium]|nr:hypothetical protein [Acidobacteriota bacterium]
MLEVIACSVADALAAEAGGADRLELVRDLEVGGLTPPFALVREVLAAVRIPVRVMLREEEDFFVQDAKKIERLCAQARSCAELSVVRSKAATAQVDGLVLGFLTGQRDAPRINHTLLAQVLASAPGTKATFHRAFEAVPDSWQAIRELKRHPQIDRILTSGDSKDINKEWPQRLTGLAELARVAAPEIAILVGGGVERNTIEALCQKKTKVEFHVGRAVREPCTNSGAVRAALVRKLVKCLQDGAAVCGGELES